MKYQGKKWFCKDVELVRNEAVWWAEEYDEKPIYTMTRGYRKWLREEAKRKALEEVKVLKSKLEYQYKCFGEVDDIDFGEYQYKLKAYMDKYGE